MEYKQVILIRADLKLPKGKSAAQAAHASVDAVLKSDKSVVSSWRAAGMKKVVLKVADKKELYLFAQAAKDLSLPMAIITDAGKTVVAPGTVTCAAIGPAPEDEVDAITKELSLY